MLLKKTRRRPLSQEPKTMLGKNPKLLFLSCLLFALLSGCSRYPLTKQEILLQYPTAKIINTGGAEGPYAELSAFVGNPDMPISVNWPTPAGVTKVDWPAEKGYYFCVNEYVNKKKEVFWVLMRLPNQR